MTDPIAEAKQAQAILESEVFQRAVRVADSGFTIEWKLAQTIDERERAHARQSALASVITALRAIAEDGLLHEQAMNSRLN